jgi:squalene-hopene/tetraprenyl-beta-curcumene cyclase
MHRLLAGLVTLSSVTFAAANPSECPAPTGTTATPPAAQGDPRTREAAQRGLEFLVRSATAWQQSNQCYGCHVHSVTVEALSVGLHNQYDLAPKALDALVDGMLKLPGGARSTEGLSYHGGSLLQPSKAFGGAAFARYDAWVGSKVRDDLVRVARELLTYQAADGHLEVQYVNGPVARGDVQATAQAIATWKQTFARTADQKWLAPVQRAEAWLQGRVKTWQQAPAGVDTQDLDYAVIGLSSAGVGPTEPSMTWLTKQVLSREAQGGGFGLTAKALADPLTTGQALYALRLLGSSDRDAAVGRGTKWLVAHQKASGGWSDAGFGKAEAMWGVLGLVSVDVMTVAVSRLGDGEHVIDEQPIEVQARDNKGDGVQQVELFIDDVSVAKACGNSLTHTWSTKSLGDRKHLVVAIATSRTGQKSQRQLEVFSGHTWLTQLGADFTDGATQVTARDLSPADVAHAVELNILKVETKAGQAVPGAAVVSRKMEGQGGALQARWDGKDAAGNSQPNGRYYAELVLRDAKGQELQRERVLFNHDSAENEAQKFGQVYGALRLKGGARGEAQAANARVELVDEKGVVVQATSSTADGNYRFKNVDSGKYKVRVQKSGYAFDDVAVTAAPAKAAEANGALSAH